MQEVEGDVVEGVVSILAEGIEKVTDGVSQTTPILD